MLRLQRPGSYVYAGQRSSANITLWQETLTITNSHSLISSRFALMAPGCMVTTAVPLSRKQNKYGTPRIAANPRLQRAERQQLKHPPIKLDSRQRPVVEQAIREVCTNRGYWLRAINVRTNHVHTVVSAAIDPEPILQAFQAYATRKLRRAGLLPEDVKPWTRHGSTPYLWKERHVERAMDYVVNGQGDELPSFDD